MKIDLVIIDPQRSFCQAANPELANAMLIQNKGKITPDIEFVKNGGELFVTGADQDCKRLATMINRLEDKIDSIHVTLDSHNEIDIAHPAFWVDNNGNPPPIFTIITKDDVLSGRYSTKHPGLLKRATEYVKALESGGRYPLCIWPPHCIIGSTGHAIQQDVSDAIRQWGKNRFKIVNFVTKGSNPLTEHYSAIKADVPDASDPNTLLNSSFISTVDKADEIWICGQALSHCVANTVRDLIAEFGAESVKKITLITDLCSNVTGFEKNGADFIAFGKSQGMKTALSTEIFPEICI